jgi:hypothetical protein
MISWKAAQKTIEYDNESMRIAKLQLGGNAEIRSLLQRAQEIKTDLLQTYLMTKSSPITFKSPQ